MEIEIGSRGFGHFVQNGVWIHIHFVSGVHRHMSSLWSYVSVWMYEWVFNISNTRRKF